MGRVGHACSASSGSVRSSHPASLRRGKHSIGGVITVASLTDKLKVAQETIASLQRQLGAAHMQLGVANAVLAQTTKELADVRGRLEKAENRLQTPRVISVQEPSSVPFQAPSPGVLPPVRQGPGQTDANGVGEGAVKSCIPGPAPSAAAILSQGLSLGTLPLTQWWQQKGYHVGQLPKPAYLQ